jgi:hypothetical protein
MNVEDPRELAPSRTTSVPPPADELSVCAVRRYALHAEIASGTVSTVHLGRLIGPERFERTVTIERLRKPFAKDPECVSSLLDGARAAASVRHPNVVPVLDVVTGDEVLVVTEYVHGVSLVALLRTERGRGARTPLAVVSGVVAGVLRGIDAVHAARSGRPSSGEGPRQADGVPACDVVVGTDGVARVTGVVVGPVAGSLEPLAGADGARPPWFGASVVLWESLAGRAFLPATPSGFEAPSRYRAGLDPAVDAVVAKGLAGAPGAGFRTAGEMAQALETALPPALPSQIGAWVESLAREALDERAHLLANLEDRAGAPAKDAPPAVDPKSQIITRRLRSTPPPAPTAPPSAPAPASAPASASAPAPAPAPASAYPPPERPPTPDRAEVTARRRGGALRGRRLATLAAGIAVPALLLLVCARYPRDARPPSPASPPAAAAPSADETRGARAEVAPPAPSAEAPPPARGEPAPPSALLRSRPRPAAPDRAGAARTQPSPRPTRDDVL